MSSLEEQLLEAGVDLEEEQNRKVEPGTGTPFKGFVEETSAETARRIDPETGPHDGEGWSEWKERIESSGGR